MWDLTVDRAIRWRCGSCKRRRRQTCRREQLMYQFLPLSPYTGSVRCDDRMPWVATQSFYVEGGTAWLCFNQERINKNEKTRKSQQTEKFWPNRDFSFFSIQSWPGLTEQNRRCTSMISLNNSRITTPNIWIPRNVPHRQHSDPLYISCDLNYVPMGPWQSTPRQEAV